MTSSGHVPGVQVSAAEAWRWVIAADVSRARRTTPDLSGRMWLQVESLGGHWEEEGTGAASSAISTLLAAAAHAGADVVLSAVRGNDRLRLLLGVRDCTGSGRTQAQAHALGGILVTVLPGSGIRQANPETSMTLLSAAWALPGRTCLFGVPKVGRFPPAVPALERFAGSGLSEWSLNLHAVPLDPTWVADRYWDVGTLRQVFAEELATSRRMNATETIQGVDPLVAELESVLGQEQKRCGAAAIHGSLNAHMWVSAPSQPAADALAAVAISAATPTGSAPFPLRAIPYAQNTGVDPATPLAPAELATLFTPPLHDVAGFQVRSWARFDADPESVEGHGGGLEQLVLGHTPRGLPATYPRDLLTRHACVTGMTGSGKSAFIRSLLSQLGALPYLVIEPTKSEYADQMEASGGTVWRIGDPSATLRLNPCEVPPGVPLSLHIDLLMGLMRSTFGLMPPLPFLLDMGLRRAYQARGWDPATGENAFGPQGGDFVGYPTLSDVLSACLDLVNELGYSGEVRNNVVGALRARLGSLTVGPKGVAFDTDDTFDEQALLAGPAVVNLDLVGNDEEKAFAVGLLLIRLLEARRGNTPHSEAPHRGRGGTSSIPANRSASRRG